MIQPIGDFIDYNRRALKRKQDRGSIGKRRAERELFFWTVLQTYKVVLLGALTVCTLIALAVDEVAGHNIVNEFLAKAGTFLF